VLHGVQEEQGPRFDCWISVQTKKRVEKKVGGWGWGWGGGKKRRVWANFVCGN